MELAASPVEDKFIPLQIPFADHTPEWLRSFKGCENYTDEQALNAIQTLDKLTKLLFELTCQKNGTIIDNKLEVFPDLENENLKLAA